MKSVITFFVSSLFFIFSCQKLPPEADFIEKNKITGTVYVDKKLDGRCGEYLFLIVRKIDSTQPIAVKRVKNSSYPYKFTISPSDVMIESNFKLFDGELFLYGRTSKSANPFSEGGYCESDVKVVKSGSNGVDIVLNSYKE